VQEVGVEQNQGREQPKLAPQSVACRELDLSKFTLKSGETMNQSLISEP